MIRKPPFQPEEFFPRKPKDEAVIRARESRAIGEYKVVLQKLLDAALMGLRIEGGYNQRWTRRNRKLTPILVGLYIDGKMTWRAMNSGAHGWKEIDAAKARIDLREYLHIKDGVRIEALDRAEEHYG